MNNSVVIGGNVSLESVCDGQAGIVTQIESKIAPKHVIHLEFVDSSDTDINVYYDDSLIETMITAYDPVTYDSKTVVIAQLDGVTWYEPTPIPIGEQLIDFSAIKKGYIIDQSTGEESESTWSCCSDFTMIDPSMTFSYICYQWYGIAFYDNSRSFISFINAYQDTGITVVGDYAHGTLTPAKIPANASYVRINTNPTNPSDTQLSLIRTE